MRCPNCGSNNRDERETCWRCGLELLSDPHVPDGLVDLPTMGSSTPGALFDDAREELAERPSPPQRRNALWQALFPSTQQIAGIIINVEPVHEERPQRSWHRFALLGLLGMLALALPFILLSVSALLAIGLVVMCIVLFKLVSPGKILHALLLFRFIWPGQRDNRVPVQYLRLRDGRQREYMVRIAGRLRGHIMPGDEVTLEGNFRNGIFEMRRGINLRTGSLLEVRNEH